MSSDVKLMSYHFQFLARHTWAKFEHQLNELLLASAYLTI